MSIQLFPSLGGGFDSRIPLFPLNILKISQLANK